MENQAQPATSQTNRRRQHFIQRKFQGRFILQFSALLILGCVSFGLAVYFYSIRTLTTAFIDSKLRVMSTADFLFPVLTLTTLVVTAVVALAAALRLMILSHKIAGPLYRLEKTAQEVGDGKLNFQVKLRSGDELQNFAKTMDEMVRDLRTRALAIKSQNDRLREIIRQANTLSAFPPELLQALKETQSRLEEATRHFQV